MQLGPGDKVKTSVSSPYRIFLPGVCAAITMSDPETTDSQGVAAGAKEAIRPTRWQRFKAHMKKWWWVYLIAFGCIVLVVVLPL